MKKSGHQHEPELAFEGSRTSKTQNANMHGSSAAEKERERKKKKWSTHQQPTGTVFTSPVMCLGSQGATKYKSEAYSTTGIKSD